MGAATSPSFRATAFAALIDDPGEGVPAPADKRNPATGQPYASMREYLLDLTRRIPP